MSSVPHSPWLNLHSSHFHWPSHTHSTWHRRQSKFFPMNSPVVDFILPQIDEDSQTASCSTPPPPNIAASPSAGVQKVSPELDPSQTDDLSSSSCPQPFAPTCCPNQSPFPHNLLLHHHIGYVIFTVTASIVLLCALMAFIWNVRSANGRNRRRAKYKSVSKFFPFSYGQQVDGSSNSVAIPEYGLPKTGQAERETLLNESDEDEI